MRWRITFKPSAVGCPRIVMNWLLVISTGVLLTRSDTELFALDKLLALE